MLNLRKKSKKFILFSIFSCFIMLFFTACPEEIPEEVILVGEFSWSEWKKDAGWDDYSAPNYVPNPEIVDSLQEIIQSKAITFIIFGANWCSKDCGVYMPQFMKLMRAIDYSEESIMIFGVDRQKTEPTNNYLKYEIDWVPTIIIFSAGEEIGKIEAGKDFKIVPLEETLLEILKKL
jgi:hypothetical protein